MHSSCLPTIYLPDTSYRPVKNVVEARFEYLPNIAKLIFNKTNTSNKTIHITQNETLKHTNNNSNIKKQKNSNRFLCNKIQYYWRRNKKNLFIGRKLNKRSEVGVNKNLLNPQNRPNPPLISADQTEPFQTEK